MSNPMQEGRPIVIVGSGLAGWSVVRELAAQGNTVPVTLVCADNGDFYSKPMLSNALAQGKTATQLVQRAAANQADHYGVTLHAHTRLESIDRARQTIVTNRGALPYRELVLALGADVLRLPTPGIEHALTVNDLQDYARFRMALEQAGPGARVVLLGCGLIGSEFANDLVNAGFAVTAVDPGPWPIGALVPEAKGRELQAALAALGVRFHFADAAEVIRRDPAGTIRVTLRSGTVLEADVLLSAVGLRPHIAIAEAAGLAVNRGVVVDELGRTSDPAIFALGDCAAYVSAARPEIAGGAPRALPFVMPLMAAAKAIAATLTGTPTPIRFGPMPVRVKTPACPLTVAG